MCDTCGCNVTSGNAHLIQPGGKLDKTESGRESLSVLKSLLSENDHQAAHNREHFDHRAILAINLMSSPGAGKTALLETTIDTLGDEFKIAVVEGDLETENDAKRIRQHGVPAVQITTGTACHLDSHMVHDALHQLDLDNIDIVFIENVGNLVCPASFDLGQHRNVVLLSVPEGDDKPAKYPVMFRAADLVLLTKCDLLPLLEDFRPHHVTQCIRELANDASVQQISARSGNGMAEWLTWLRHEVDAQRTRCARGDSVRPTIQPEGAALHATPHAHHHHHT